MLRIPTAARPESRGSRARGHARQRRDVVRVRVHVGRELWGGQADRAAGDPALDRDPCPGRPRSHAAPRARDACARERIPTASLRRQLRRRCRSQLDRCRRIVVGADLLCRSVRGRGEQTGVDRLTKSARPQRRSPCLRYRRSLPAARDRRVALGGAYPLVPIENGVAPEQRDDPSERQKRAERNRRLSRLPAVSREEKSRRDECDEEADEHGDDHGDPEPCAEEGGEPSRHPARDRADRRARSRIASPAPPRGR